MRNGYGILTKYQQDPEAGYWLNGKLDKPEKARFTSGHFIFTLGKFCQEVPYDPKLYFHGEELGGGSAGI